MKYNPDSQNKQKPGSKYLKNPEDKKKSKYLRDENDKKSKYLKDNNSRQEHHYNLARHYDEDGQKKVDITSDNRFNTRDSIVEAAEKEAEKNVIFKETEITSDETLNSPAQEIENAPEEGAVQIEEQQEAPVEEALIDAELSEEATDVNAEITDEEENEEIEKSKGDISSLFQHSKISKDTAIAGASVEKQEEKARSRVALSMLVSMILLTVFACILQRLRINHELLPTMLSIEFSAFPELIASLAYGPFFGLIIIVIKSVVRIIFDYSGVATVLSNFVLDSVFVIVAGLFYSRRMFVINPKKSMKPKTKDLRRQRILAGGLLATVITTAVSYFLTRYASYPIMFREFSNSGITADYVLNLYQVALDRLNTLLPEKMSGAVLRFTDLSQAIMFYNIPVQFFKYLIISIVVAVIYVPISPYLHFRKKQEIDDD